MKSLCNRFLAISFAFFFFFCNNETTFFVCNDCFNDNFSFVFFLFDFPIFEADMLHLSDSRRDSSFFFFFMHCKRGKKDEKKISFRNAETQSLSLSSSLSLSVFRDNVLNRLGEIQLAESRKPAGKR